MVESAEPTVRPSRREAQRVSFVADIKAEARRQLAERGAAGVSWRRIAATLGVNAASLYTYFDNLEALITELLVDSYDDLAAAVQQATSEPALSASERLRAGAEAYREWALANRAAFNLVFTDQIPGYAAPEDGPTTDAQIGALRPIAVAVADVLGADIAELREDGPALHTFLALWAQVHGATALEVNHHLDWLDVSALFDHIVDQQLRLLDRPE